MQAPCMHVRVCMDRTHICTHMVLVVLVHVQTMCGINNSEAAAKRVENGPVAETAACVCGRR